MRRPLKQLEVLAKNPEFAPVALRLLGLLEFQQGHFDAAAARFAELLRQEKYLRRCVLLSGDDRGPQR